MSQRRTYSRAHVQKLEVKIMGLETDLMRKQQDWETERGEVRRYEQLIDARWDEMQRLRDLLRMALVTQKTFDKGPGIPERSLEAPRKARETRLAGPVR